MSGVRLVLDTYIFHQYVVFIPTPLVAAILRRQQTEGGNESQTNCLFVPLGLFVRMVLLNVDWV